jgi:hypothetical protein
LDRWPCVLLLISGQGLLLLDIQENGVDKVAQLSLVRQIVFCLPSFSRFE